MILFYFLSKRWINKNLFQTSILILILGASLNSVLVFWMHEETNEKKHNHYAVQLAEMRDTVAENGISRIITKLKNSSYNSNQQYLWEEEWIKDDYLASNYRFEIDTNKIDSSSTFYKP